MKLFPDLEDPLEWGGGGGGGSSEESSRKPCCGTLKM